MIKYRCTHFVNVYVSLFLFRPFVPIINRFVPFSINFEITPILIVEKKYERFMHKCERLFIFDSSPALTCFENVYISRHEENII